jgi:hypothetical protein
MPPVLKNLLAVVVAIPQHGACIQTLVIPNFFNKVAPPTRPILSDISFNCRVACVAYINLVKNHWPFTRIPIKFFLHTRKHAHKRDILKWMGNDGI